MSLTTPTTQQINDAIIAQLETSLNQSIPLLPKSFLRVLAKTLSAVFILLYKYAGFMFLQLFVKTASYAETEINGVFINPLLEWGRLIGVGDPAKATQAELLVQITVENQTGSLASGTQLVGPSNGVTYITLGSVELNASTVQATIRAVSDQTGGGGRGAVGNLNSGANVSFANPIANISRTALVVSQVVTGSEAEEVEAYRQRIIDRFQKRPQGGAYADYELWAEEPAGIIHAYPYTSTSPGQVDVYVEATPESSGSPDGIPTGAQLQEVLDSINYDSNGLANRRNANAFVNAYPITRTAFDVRVTGIADVDDLASVQSTITEAVKEYFLSVEPFIAGLSVPPRSDRLTRTRVSAIVESVVTAAGGTFTSAVFSQTGVIGSLDSYSLTEGEKAKAANVVFL